MPFPPPLPLLFHQRHAPNQLVPNHQVEARQQAEKARVVPPVPRARVHPETRQAERVRGRDEAAQRHAGKELGFEGFSGTRPRGGQPTRHRAGCPPVRGFHRPPPSPAPFPTRAAPEGAADKQLKAGIETRSPPPRFTHPLRLLRRIAPPPHHLHHLIQYLAIVGGEAVWRDVGGGRE